MNKTEKPTITIAIPARNETKELASTLRELTRLDYQKLEIIVLDDCSQDKTSSIIKDFAHKGVRFIQGSVPPENWLGKNYAMKQLAGQASGEFILYTDADNPVSDNLINILLEDLENTNLPSSIATEGANTYINFLSQSVFQPWFLATDGAHMHLNQKINCWLVNTSVLKEKYDLLLKDANYIQSPSLAMRIHRDITANERGLAGVVQQSRSEDFIPNTYFSIKKNHLYFIRTLSPNLGHKAIWITFFLIWMFLILMLVLGSIGASISTLWAVLCVFTGSMLMTIALGWNQLFNDGSKPLSKKLAMLLVRALVLPAALLYGAWLCAESVFRYKTNRVEWRGRNICFPVEARK